MFKAITDNDRLQQFVQNATAMAEEAKLHLDSSELSTSVVDPASVGMVHQQLEATGFESYEADGGLIGANMNRLEDVAKMGDGLMSLELDEEIRKLRIEQDGLDYTLALIDPDGIRKEPDLPSLDLPVEVDIEWSKVQQAIRAGDMVSDHIAIGADADDETLWFQAEGDTDDVYVEYGADELEASTFDGDAHSLYSLDYLKDVRTLPGADTVVTLRVGEAFPLKFEWQFADGHGAATFMLAPRIQDE